MVIEAPEVDASGILKVDGRVVDTQRMEKTLPMIRQWDDALLTLTAFTLRVNGTVTTSHGFSLFTLRLCGSNYRLLDHGPWMRVPPGEHWL
ncbi:hypothetical protein THIOKS1680005 [Thiocapsa sp. KS1]|nr:hypothetical protein [Thiocapsa sp. KS1]CRI67549.1 hypothetical protein THIOKS1680005 [Thiocapsa sp. KS1]